MASSKNASLLILPKKRPVDDGDDCELEEYRKPKTVVPKYPPPKRRTGVQVVRDFPPGCGIKEESLIPITGERNPLKDLENVDYKPGRITTEGKDKLVDSNSFQNSNHKSLKPKGLLRNNPFVASKPPGKVKFWDPTKERDAKKPKVTRIVSKNKKLMRNNPALAKWPAEGDAQEAKVTSIGVSRASGNNKFTSFKTKELGRNNPSSGSWPIGKVKFWDPTVGDAKNPKVTTTFTKNDQLISSKPKEIGSNNRCFGSRPGGKVKFWDPNSPEEGDAQKSNDNPKEQVRREKIKEAMSLFDKFNTELCKLNRSKPKEQSMCHWRVTLEAAKMVQQKLKWMDAKKTLGSICGVQVGDKFRYRAQLKMIGLHCQPQSGIDYTMIGGRNLAISIVDSHRYSNQRQSCEELCYSGHGGISYLGSKRICPEDQKLERGNLALKNSMMEKNPVRVIRKLQGFGKDEVYVYDGLYVVEDYTEKKGEQRKMVFMFKLRRKPGQPQLHQMLKW